MTAEHAKSEPDFCNEPSTGDLRDRLAASRERLLKRICRCGKQIAESCGFHPEGEECMCFGTICDKCLHEMLGHVNSDHD